MRHEAGHACRPTRTRPCAVQILDTLAVPAEEDPGHDLPGRAGKGVSLFLLRLQDTSESGDERKLSAFTVLRFAWLEPEPTGAKIAMSPLTSRQFGSEAPPREISGLDQRLEVIRQRRNDGVENFRFEKALAGIVLL